MFTITLLIIAAVFIVAGVVKGVIGLGLQVLPMVLLVLIMPPMEAAALLVIPGLVSNAWQIASSPAAGAVFARIWPMLASICAGTWLGGYLDIGMMGPHAGTAKALLAVVIIGYAALGLAKWRFAVAPQREPMAGPLCGVVNGLITAATGVFVVPAVPYLAALGLSKDELVQALGQTFLVATLALAVNLLQAGALSSGVTGLGLVALAASLIGMTIGQYVRSRLDAETFRTCFFAGLLGLGMFVGWRVLAG